METIKKGDSLPISGRIEIRDYDEATGFYLEVTDQIDFSEWTMSCQIKDKAGTVVATVPLEFIGTSPAFSASVATDSWVVGEKYRVDIRFRDAAGDVNSTATREIKVLEAVSEVPA